ncbi:PepSY domain-containing protein [Paenibacillus mendelii]|uniref:PepSY domain-containing protein n=1 Tax=Paenibacillus mendelii TaxID=206163 RepID=A0ABV6JEI8_9BACL|nr:PepSY domain-containing protein [Paenibacillus mendelii]
MTLILRRTETKPGITLNEAKQEVLNQYEGTIVSAESNGSSYLVRLQSETGLYELNVDKDHADITGIKSIERYTDSVPDGTSSPDNNQPTDPGTNPSPTPTSPTDLPDKETVLNPDVFLNEDEAAKLALSKVDGTVTDLDIEKTHGKWYYIIEVETPDGREADVQINAASGAIQSVTWDDEDDDKEK